MTCAVPALAQGSTATHSSGGLVVNGGAGERNSLKITFDGSAYLVREQTFATGVAPTPLTAGTGCFKPDPAVQEVRCSRGANAAALVTVNAGDGDDRVDLSCNDSPPVPDGFVDGGAGNDSLQGGPGRDALDGKAGDDNAFGCSDQDAVKGGDGSDNLSGGSGSDTLEGGSGGDTLQNGSDGADVISGGDGVDTLKHQSVTDASASHTFSLDGVANDVDGAFSGENVKADVENISILDGLTRPDVLIGNSSRNRLEGGGGNDTISGGTPAGASAFSAQVPITIAIPPLMLTDDTLLGGPGDDTLNGQGGPDRIEGGIGADSINGGSGDDDVRARDAIEDTINCSSGTDFADLDLRDPDPLGCENTDRGAVKEGYNVGMPIRAFTRSPRRVGVRLACRRSVRRGCRGTLTAGSRGKLGRVRYALRRGQRRTIAVALPARDRRTLARRRRVTLRLRSVERGSLGQKTGIRRLTVRLRR
jgi:Ca2+-binding RTX toxin-like protein